MEGKTKPEEVRYSRKSPFTRCVLGAPRGRLSQSPDPRWVRAPTFDTAFMGPLLTIEYVPHNGNPLVHPSHVLLVDHLDCPKPPGP